MAAKKRGAKRATGGPAAKKQKKSDDPIWCVTSKRSPLVKEDLYALYSNPDTYEKWTQEDWLEARKTLPDDAPYNEDGISVPITYFKYDVDWRRYVREFQEDLEEGRLEPEWQKQANEAIEARARGDFDRWKAEEFEEFWGQKQRTNSRELAGESAQVKLESLVEHQRIRVGDVISYARVFGKSKDRIMIEKDARVMKAEEGTLTVGIPPGQLKYARYLPTPEQTPRKAHSEDRTAASEIAVNGSNLDLQSGGHEITDENGPSTPPVEAPSPSTTHLLLTRPGTDPDEFRTLIEDLDGAIGQHYFAEQASYQSYLSDLDAPQVARALANPIVQSCVLNNSSQTIDNLKLSPEDTNTHEDPASPSILISRACNGDTKLPAEVAVNGHVADPSSMNISETRTNTKSGFSTNQSAVADTLDDSSPANLKASEEMVIAIETSPPQAGAPAGVNGTEGGQTDAVISIVALPDRQSKTGPVPDAVVNDTGQPEPSPLSHESPQTSQSPAEDVILVTISTLTELERHMVAADGRIPMQGYRSINSWKAMRAKRDNQDMGSLFDIREAWFVSQSNTIVKEPTFSRRSGREIKKSQKG